MSRRTRNPEAKGAMSSTSDDVHKEADSVKDYLFEYINDSELIPQLISEKKFDVIIDDVIENCFERVAAMGKREEAIGVLATGLLHYLLTNSLIPSQRKVEYKGQEIDIVIPDVKTLEEDAKRALVICIPKTSDIDAIKERLLELEEIQPEKANVWLVLSDYVETGRRTFVLNRKNNTFSGIIFEIARFVSVGETANKLKILRIGQN